MKNVVVISGTIVIALSAYAAEAFVNKAFYSLVFFGMIAVVIGLLPEPIKNKRD